MGGEGHQPEDRDPQGLVTSAWRGRRWNPDGTDVFCNQPGRPSALPDPLLATDHFVVVPDAFPVTPGHLLVIPRRHFPCYGAVPARWDGELDAIVSRMRSFLRDAYGAEPMLWENGAVGQSVHHAHLHLIPMPGHTRLPAPEEAVAVGSFHAVRRWFGRAQRPYHYMALGADRRVLPPGSPDVRTASLFKGQVLQVPLSPDGRAWVRQPNPAAVALLRQRYALWGLAHPLQRPAPESSLGL